MNFNNNIVGTGPIGFWNISQMIGAKVRVQSTSVRSGLFGYTNDVYRIKDINFYIGDTGRLRTAVTLDGLDRTFGWGDLEVLELVSFGIWQRAICGTFCCGSSICGYETKEYEGSI